MSQVKLVIFDLDGTVLDTETLVAGVAAGIVEKHGAKLTPEVIKASLGKRPLEAWQTAIDMLSLDCTAQQLYDESEPLLVDRWKDAKLMPGAARLLLHLHRHGVPVGIATSTPRATFIRKMSDKSLKVILQNVTCGDEVVNGKPAPDCFRAAAEKAGVSPSECLAIEDAPSGVAAATAAGMRVVVVPSLTQKEDYPQAVPEGDAGCVALLNSLYDFQPEAYGLPPFDDLVAGTVPMDPVWRLQGTVVKGFGRGSRELGIPTANLDPESLRGALAEAVTGIYCGWASVGDSPQVYQMVMSIGWNPFYQNKERTAEPWILHTFEQDFYGQQIRLLVCAYIRPEANFTSLEALIARIHEDAEVTRAALSQPELAQYSTDPFLLPLEALSIQDLVTPSGELEGGSIQTVLDDAADGEVDHS